MPIGTQDKPFEGTFSGDGYAVIGLNVNSGDYSGMFGVIGKSGLVKDISVIDCDFADDFSVKYAGGIAAVNNGTIDHCTSGVNLATTKKIKGKKISEYNSFVAGAQAGGVTAVNNGTITGTRSSAYVIGTQCAGIACVNNGTIYGSANNGPIGTNSAACKESGGLVCENSGTIASCYNSGNENGDYKTVLASVAVRNNSDKIENVFYTKVNNIPTLGSSNETPLGAGCEMVNNSDMIKTSFVDKLNSVTDDSVEWIKSTYGKLVFNQSYPLVKGRFLEQRTIKAMNGKITVTGTMHSSLNAAYAQMPASDPEYAQFESVGGEGSVKAAYSVTTTDENGNYIPGQLWSSGVTITVPVTSSSDSIVAINENGEAVKVENVVIKDNKATFEAPEAVSFAVVGTSSSKNSSASSDNSSKKNTTSSAANKTSSNGNVTEGKADTPKTGARGSFGDAYTVALMFAIAALSLAGAFVSARGRRKSN